MRMSASVKKKSRVRNFVLAQLFELIQENNLGKKDNENECEEKKQRS